MMPATDIMDAPPGAAPSAGAVAPPPLSRPIPIPRRFGILTASYRYMLRPRLCGAVLATTPRTAIAGFLLSLLLIGAGIHTAILIDLMWEADWWRNEINILSVEEAWRSLQMKPYAPIWTTVLILGGCAAGGFVVAVALSLLSMPHVHRSGPAMASFGRSCCAAMGCIAPLSVLVCLMGVAIGLCSNVVESTMMTEPGDILLAIVPWIIATCVFTCIACVPLLGLWIREAAIGARSPRPLPSEPPWCELCGYDLTHVSAGGRCTECGSPTDVSFGPAARRKGVAWERHMRPTTWARATVNILLRPRDFYEQVHMRSDERCALRFQTLSYLGTGAASAVLALTVACLDSPLDFDEFIGIPAFSFVITVAGGWLLHSTIGFVAALLSFYRPGRRPFAYISKIWQYESAYLWVVLVVGYTFVFSFTFFDDWLSQIVRAVGGRWFLEPFIVLATIGACLVYWLLRFGRAVRTARWANT